ncbi:MAG: MFS transporter, partial [Acetobacteraceae bacterium]|nr:MFS transporter [Acetobacteraceae bacterium]
MLELLERQQRLTTNQRKIITTLVLVGILVSFDLLVIGFAAGYMSADRHLSHPQLPRIQLTAGCGGLLGAVVWGGLADRIGRRAVLFGTVLNTALATGMMALTPEGDGFLVVAVCQSLASFGAAGAFVPLVCVVQEFVPASKRGWISAMALWLVHLGSTGVVFAGLKLTPIIGWRGMLLTGLVPALSIILIWLWIPESPRWLICRGRLDEARKSIAWALQIEPDWVETPAASAKAPPQAWWRLFRYSRSIAVTCLTSLGQTGTVGSQQWAIFLLVSILNITWGAPQLFYLVMGPGLAGFAGQFVVAYLSDTIGRRGTGMLCGFSAGVALVLAGLFRDMVLGGVSI